MFIFYCFGAKFSIESPHHNRLPNTISEPSTFCIVTWMERKKPRPGDIFRWETGGTVNQIRGYVQRRFRSAGTCRAATNYTLHPQL